MIGLHFGGFQRSFYVICHPLNGHVYFVTVWELDAIDMNDH